MKNIPPPCCSFGGGSFRDKMRSKAAEQANLSEQITVRQDENARSHTAGFEVSEVVVASGCAAPLRDAVTERPAADGSARQCKLGCASPFNPPPHTNPPHP
jgi:hypothetical protein